MHRVGLISKWLTDSLPQKDQCWTNTQMGLTITNHKVNLDDMQGSFIVLLLGKFTHIKIYIFTLNVLLFLICLRCIIVNCVIFI